MTERRTLCPPHVARLVAYVPGKPLEELERELGVRDAVKLASNENPLGPSPRALEAAARAMRDAHRYPEGTGYLLRHEIARRFGVSPEEVVLGNGSNELIELLVRTFAEPRADHAVYGDPSFVIFGSALAAHDVTATAVPLRDRVQFDVDDLLAAVRPTTRLLFVANPNNPTGTYLAEPELRRLLAGLGPDVIPVVDEAYVHFADAADYADSLKLRGAHPRLVTLRSFSKAYGLAGFRVGFAIMPAEMAGYVHRVRAPFNVGSVAQAAALAALGDTDHVARAVELAVRERVRVSAALTQLGLRVTPSQGNFVLVDLGRPGAEVYERMLRLGVIVRPMPSPIASSVRISIGLEGENDRMLDAIARVLQP